MSRESYSDGYEGVTHAGLAVVRYDGGVSVLLAQRAFDESDDPDVQESWEFPGGSIESGEDPFEGASREFEEEIGFPLPVGEVRNGWRRKDGHYQGFVYEATEFPSVTEWNPTEEVQAVQWVTPKEAQDLRLRPEMMDFDWSLLEVSGNEGEMQEEQEPELTFSDVMLAPIPIHGVLAPEELESGDGRGFNAGSVTARPYRLPFMWQREQRDGHDSAVTVGSVDRLMRKDGLIHWSGLLMPSETAGEFAELLSFFGRYGVSVDGDKGSVDSGKSSRTGALWYDAIRSAGLTAVSIPAFAEAYVAFGPHPDMPEQDSEEYAVLSASGDLVQFDRGPGWVTHPEDTRRIHAYWTSPGQPGYAKIGWGTPGDFTRAKKLIGQKIGANSPEDLRYLNQIIAQWHHDALGYWPGEANKPGNPTTEEIRRRYQHSNSGVRVDSEGLGWEAVLSASAGSTLPPIEYFDFHPDSAAVVVSDPDEYGFIRTYGYVGEWGVCHIGNESSCVPVPEDPAGGDFPDFHLGRTRVEGGGYIPTGLITYKVDHRSAEAILTESAEQQHFDNIAHAWAAVRLGQDDRGIWFSGVVLPGVDKDDLTLIEASGQISGEWRYGSLRAIQSVNTPGFPVQRSSAAYDDEGNIVALAASMTGAECEPSPKERMEALRKIDAEARFQEVNRKFAALMKRGL